MGRRNGHAKGEFERLASIGTRSSKVFENKYVPLLPKFVLTEVLSQCQRYILSVL